MSRLKLSGFALLALAAACHSSASSDAHGAGTIEVVTTPGANDGTVARAVASVPDQNRTVDLAQNGGRWEGWVDNVTGGIDHTVKTDWFDKNGNRLGGSDPATVPVREATSSFVDLQAALQPQQVDKVSGNTTPTITQFVAAPTSVVWSDQVSLTAIATDPDAGDHIATVTWTATGGTFSSASQTNPPQSPTNPTQTPLSTTWIAPNTTGTYTITLKVNDTHGASRTSTVQVHVSTAYGSAQVSASFNQAPNVTSITAASSYFAPGQSTQLTSAASDPDGDTLTYAWSSPCGTFNDATAASPSFTLKPTDALNVSCVASLVVTDGHGGTSSNYIGVTTTSTTMPPASEPPVIDVTLQSNVTPAFGEHVAISVQAHDPGGRAVSFTTAVAGGAGGVLASNTATPDLVTIDWTPPCGVTATTITVTATNLAGQTAAQQFIVNSGGTVVATGLTSGVDQLAIAGSQLYFSNKSTNSLSTVATAGGAIASIRTNEPITDLATDGTVLYWSNPSTYAVRRQAINSSVVSTLYSGTSARIPGQLVVGGGAVYFGAGKLLFDIAVTGGTATSYGTGFSSVTGLAFDSGTSLFVTDKTASKLYHFTAPQVSAVFPLSAASAVVSNAGIAYVEASDGLDAVNISSGVAATTNLAPAGAHVYVDNASAPPRLVANEGTNLYAGPLTGPVTEFACIGETIGEFVTDAAGVYVVLPTSGRIAKISK